MECWNRAGEKMYLLHRVSHFNLAAIALTAFSKEFDSEFLKILIESLFRLI
jgi:hypothetical protein